MSDTPPENRPGEIQVYSAEGANIKLLCDFPAPLVVNGAMYVGCQLPKDHKGLHKVEVTWGTGD